MTIASILNAKLKNRYGQTEYSQDLVDEFLEIMDTTYDEYNRVALCADIDEDTPEGVGLYLFGGGSYWYPPVGGGFNTNAVIESVVAAGIAADAGGDEFLMVDIEAWDLLTERDEALENLLRAVKPWHESGKRPIGLYKQLPYYNPTVGANLKTAIDAESIKGEAVARSKITTWMRQNDANYAVLGEYVDVLIPRSYVNAADSIAAWRWYTGLQIYEAIRLARGKPVWPILWFRYAGSEPYLEMAEAEYIDALKFVSSFPGVAGTIVWVDTHEVPALFDYTAVVEDLITGGAEGDFPDPVLPP